MSEGQPTCKGRDGCVPVGGAAGRHGRWRGRGIWSGFPHWPLAGAKGCRDKFLTQSSPAKFRTVLSLSRSFLRLAPALFVTKYTAFFSLLSFPRRQQATDALSRLRDRIRPTVQHPVVVEQDQVYLGEKLSGLLSRRDKDRRPPWPRRMLVSERQGCTGVQRDRHSCEHNRRHGRRGDLRFASFLALFQVSLLDGCIAGCWWRERREIPRGGMRQSFMVVHFLIKSQRLYP